ncbi:MAG: hypothetical protein NTY04_01970 [Candidatus Staskawiczbacteria bacterium]|nr:hypothetical protein [Candidatus Staskawiczbacteria bacterium]
MATEKSIIFNRTVNHDDSVSEGMYYLSRQLNMEEAKVFFDEAYNKGHAEFQNRMGYHFRLVYHDGEYELVKA